MQLFAQIVPIKNLENHRVYLTPIQVYQSLGHTSLAMGTVAWYVQYEQLQRDEQTNTIWSKAYSVVTAMDTTVTLADLIESSDLENYRIISMTVFHGWVNGAVKLERELNRSGWDEHMRSQYPNVIIEHFIDLDAVRDTPLESGMEAEK